MRIFVSDGTVLRKHFTFILLFNSVNSFCNVAIFFRILNIGSTAVIFKPVSFTLYNAISCSVAPERISPVVTSGSTAVPAFGVPLITAYSVDSISELSFFLYLLTMMSFRFMPCVPFAIVTSVYPLAGITSLRPCIQYTASNIRMLLLVSTCASDSRPPSNT